MRILFFGIPHNDICQKSEKIIFFNLNSLKIYTTIIFNVPSNKEEVSYTCNAENAVHYSKCKLS